MTTAPLSTAKNGYHPRVAGARRLGRYWLLPAALGLGALLLAALLLPPQQLGPGNSELALSPRLPGQLAVIIPENNWGWGWKMFWPLQMTISTDNPLALTANSQQLLAPLLLKIVIPWLALSAAPLLLMLLVPSWRPLAVRALGFAASFLLLTLLAASASYWFADEPQFLRQQEQSAQLWAIYQDYQRPVPALQRYEIPGQELIYQR